MEGRFLLTNSLMYWFVLTWKKGKKGKEKRSGLNVTEHSTSPPHEGFSSSEDKMGSVEWHSHDFSNASTLGTKGIITVWSYNSSLTHRKGFSPGICLIGGVTLHLIRCVRKVKLAKIISQLFCFLRRKKLFIQMCYSPSKNAHANTYKMPCLGISKLQCFDFSFT